MWKYLNVDREYNEHLSAKAEIKVKNRNQNELSFEPTNTMFSIVKKKNVLLFHTFLYIVTPSFQFVLKSENNNQ